MASLWGVSWFNSWGDSWGELTPRAIEIGIGIALDGVFGESINFDLSSLESIPVKVTFGNAFSIAECFGLGGLTSGSFAACILNSAMFGGSSTVSGSLGYNDAINDTFSKGKSVSSSFGRGVSINEQY